MKEAETNNPAYNLRPFVMKWHDATRLHYDLRLGGDCGAYSWALPQGPSLIAEAIREAIEMEVHSLANLMFEGWHKTGTIMLWDCGAWKPQLGFEDVRSSLARGILQFTLYGKKLKGGWTLLRTSRAGVLRPHWILQKQPDLFARGHSDICILKELPNSISTGRTLAQILHDWKTPKATNPQQMKLF